MLDAYCKAKVEPILDKASIYLVRYGVSSNSLTLWGFIIGILGVVCIGVGYFTLALVAILVNRLCDGLDGAVARRVGVTDFGGFFDITCDFIFYSAVPLGFVLYAPHVNYVGGTMLMLSFVSTGTSFLAYSIIESKSEVKSKDREQYNRQKSFFYAYGLIEGFESIIFFVIVCLIPGWFNILGIIFASLCFLTTIQRIWQARKSFR